MSQAHYIVFGAGYGSEYVAGIPGSGHVAYRGDSLTAAKRSLAKEQAGVRRLRRTVGNQNASDTYGIWAISPAYRTWVPLDRFEA